MEQKVTRSARCCPPEPKPYPWLFFDHGRKEQTFCDILHKEKHAPTKSIPELRRKEIFPCSHGWIFLLDREGNSSLWNPVSLESIQLPSLDFCPDDCIFDEAGSLIILFVKSSQFKLMFCSVGDEQWTEQSFDDMVSLTRPVWCQGKLYAIGYTRREDEYALVDQLVCIDRNSQDGFVVQLLERLPNIRDRFASLYTPHLVESCGEIFLSFLNIGGYRFEDVISVQVCKLDFMLMEWSEVKSIKDRVFFLDKITAYSCLATDCGMLGNCIYFTRNENSVFQFHLGTNTLSMCLPRPNLKTPWSLPVWIMPDFVHREVKSILGHDIQEEFVPCIAHKEVKEASKEEEVRESNFFNDFPALLLSLQVAERLFYHDYNNLRAVNKSCREAVVKKKWRISPCLISCKIGETQCQLINPRLLPKRYLVSIPNQSNEIRMCYSRNGWCVMSQGEVTVFFWNPSTGKVIPLPDRPHREFVLIIGCAFSSPPDSSNSKLVLISGWGSVYIDFILVDGGDWQSYVFDDLVDFRLTPVFYNGEIYILDISGILGVFKTDFTFEKKLGTPCSSFYQRFLLEHDGKLTSVFVGDKGKWIKVFELDQPNMVWVEVNNLGDKTIYVSHISSFSTTTMMDRMKNKVCVPRFWRNSLLCYCLVSRKYYCYGSDKIVDDFMDTEEQLECGWIDHIDPKLLEH